MRWRALRLVLRLGAGDEDLDDEHAAATARAWTRFGACFDSVSGGLNSLRWRCGRRHVKQLADAGQVGGALAVGEHAVVADAMEVLGQHVHQEAADELVGGQSHRLVSAKSVDAVVLVSEGDAALDGLDEAVV
jgi:hypothetical protein